MEGVLYCKPHFEQLFKETGNFSKKFQSRRCLSFLLLDENRLYDFSTVMFGMNRFRVVHVPFKIINRSRKSYRCKHLYRFHGGCPTSPSNYAAIEGILYCKHHFSQLFKEKGSNHHLIKSASIKRTAVPVPEP
ncbi:hypothetical protein GQ457_14G024540 [Hibiscus cannabinus]